MMKLLMTFTTLMGLLYGIITAQGFLKENFVEKDTPLKQSVNRFLNGYQ